MQAERRRLEARLRNLSAETAADFATADEIRRAVEELGGMVGLLKVSQPKLRTRFYEEVGLTATFDPTTRSVEASADLGVLNDRVGGGTAPIPTWPEVEGVLEMAP